MFRATTIYSPEFPVSATGSEVVPHPDSDAIKMAMAENNRTFIILFPFMIRHFSGWLSRQPTLPTELVVPGRFACHKGTIGQITLQAPVTGSP